MLSPKPRKGIQHKEVSFEHEGREYTVVIQVVQRTLDSAEMRGRIGKPMKLNSAYLYDMTSYRENN